MKKISKKKESLRKLNEIKKEILKKNTKNPIITKFIYLQRKYKIENKVAFQLIEGIKTDLKETVEIKDNKELILYCYSVAGTVGYMFCKIVNVNDKKLYLRAIQLGIGMQRTNISRDVKEDLEANRIYLPKTFREFKGEKKKILANQNIRQSISQDLKNFLLKTNSYYLNSWEGIKKLPLRYSITVSIAAELYQRIGLKIINNNCNVWEKRIHLKLFEKIYYTFFALIKLFFSKNKINKEIDRECKNVLKRFKIL